MKSIKAKILVSMLSLVFISVTLIVVMTSVSNYRSTYDTLEKTLTETVEISAKWLQAELNNYIDTAIELSEDEILTQDLPATTASNYTQVKNEILQQSALVMEMQNISELVIFDKNGIEKNYGVDVSGEPFFDVLKNSLAPVIGDPMVSVADGELRFYIMAPIVKNDQFNGIISFGVNAGELNNIVNGLQVGETGEATVINANGDTIIYKDIELVKEKYNANTEVQNDPSLQALAELEAKLMAGETGFGEYSYAGVSQIAAYTPIPNTQGWGIYLTAGRDEFLASLYNSIIVSIALVVAVIIVSTFIIIGVARKISKPIKQCTERLELLAQGDLDTPIPVITEKDETGRLYESTKTIVNSLSIIIPDLCDGLSDMAKGNFDLHSDVDEEYVGEYSKLASGMYDLLKKMSVTLSKISTVSSQVNNGAGQVSVGAQSLAQGSTEQASAIEQLAASIDDISGKISQTAEDSKGAKDANLEAQNAILSCNNQMEEMMIAMKNISEKSNEISNIIKVIDDIAFQTNILSLNAAVEAARAGAAGKGFAVVSDEVRTLATKSAQSAKDTALLIDETVKVVEDGNKIASNTLHSINLLRESAEKLDGFVNNIAVASEDQAVSVGEISIGISQISAVVQTNTATSEESAAASEELSSQAAMLRDLVGGFKINKSFLQ